MGSEAQFVFGLERALNSRPAQGEIQTRYLRGFNSLVSRRGADPRRMLERHDIDPAIFVDPDSQIACISAATMLEHCGSRLDDPLFGLHLADFQDPDVFGPVTALARAAPTFRQGLQCLTDYLPVFNSPEGEVEVLESASAVELRWRTRGELNDIQQPKLHGFMLMLKTLQMLGGSHFRPLHLRVGFELSSRGVRALEDRAGCKVLRSDVNAIAVASDVLDRPIATSNSLVYELLGGYLGRVRDAARPSLEAQIEAFVRTALPGGHFTIDRCAARLGVSTRTLQKRLSRAGLRFSEIVETERVAMAKDALRSGRRTLDEIALSLGYSDQTCFGRAFKRWTGLTPQAFREKHSSAPAAA
jgi:AraC-like DNA-binding protein